MGDGTPKGLPLNFRFFRPHPSLSFGVLRDLLKGEGDQLAPPRDGEPLSSSTLVLVVF